MPHYYPNRLQELRGDRISLHVLKKVSGLGVTRLRMLEEQGLPSEVPRSSLEAIARHLQVPVKHVFPTLEDVAPTPPPPPFVQELVQEQTSPHALPPQGPRPRKVQLLRPFFNDGVWEVALDARVGSRAVFQDLLASAEERGGWKSIGRQSISVHGGRKFHRTLLIFQDQQDAEKFYEEWSGFTYFPDPPPTVVEVVHRHVPPAVVSSPLELAPLELAPEAEPSEPNEENSEPEVPSLDEEDGGVLTLSAELSPKLMGYYRKLQAQYGRGLAKAILISGLTQLAQAFDL